MVRRVVAAWVLWAGCGSGVEQPGDGGVAATDAPAPVDEGSPPDVRGAEDALEALPADSAQVAGGGLVADPAQLDFGTFHLGCPRASATVHVTNRAASVSEPLLVTLDKPFRIGRDDCSGGQLEPGAKCGVEIQVTPEEPGTLTGAVRIWSTPADLVAVPVKVTAEDAVPALFLSPSVLEFEPVMVGQSAARRVTVSVPEGFQTVPKVTVSLAGSEFAISQDGCLGMTLKGGQMCAVELTFRPTAVGSRTAALTVSAPAPCPPFQSQVLLKGTGL